MTIVVINKNLCKSHFRWNKNILLIVTIIYSTNFSSVKIQCVTKIVSKLKFIEIKTLLNRSSVK